MSMELHCDRKCKSSQADSDGAAGRFGRREFLGWSAAAGAGALLAPSVLQAAEKNSDGLATRVLGRTKQRVTVLGLGTAPIGEGPVGVDEAAKIFAAVIDRGVNYVDTARIYGNAEEALGKIMPKRRDKLFLVTKVSTDNGARAEKSLDESLRLLKTDRIDLVHIHSMGSKQPKKVLADEGVLNFLLKAQKKGKLRFIGLSGHNRPLRFLEIIKTGKIDVVMPVMNYADRNKYNFETKVLPECVKRNIGVAAMKVYVGIKGGFRNHRNASVGCPTPGKLLGDAMAYALDLKGVSTAVVGPYTMAQAVENVELAKKYKPLTEAQLKALLGRGKELAKTIGPRYGPITRLRHAALTGQYA